MKKLFTVAIALLSLLPMNAQDVIQFLPKSTNAGVVEDDEEYLSLQMVNTIAPTLLQLTIAVPDGMTLITDYVDLNPDRFDGTTRRGVFTPYHTVDFSRNDDGTYLLIIYDNDLGVVKGSEGEIAQIYFETSEDMAPGYYPIIISDTKMAVDEIPEHGKMPATSVSYVKIGTPSDNALLDLGDYLVPPFVEDALPEKNVIVNGECATLSLTDGYPFSSPKPFTAASASYSRTMANDWGTICLPYAIESCSDLQVYELKSRDENTLVFTAVDALEAGKPGVFKKASEVASVNVNASNVAVVCSPAEGDAIAGLKLVGSFAKARVDVDASAPSYYIKDNTFMKGNEYFNVGAFRAYFESDGGASAAALRIAVEDATGIVTVVGELDAESGAIYTLGGVKVKNATDKGVYILNGKKFFNK